jgi:hypothetical protein
MTKEKIELLKNLGYKYYIQDSGKFRYFLMHQDARYYVNSREIEIKKIGSNEVVYRMVFDRI